MLEGKADVAGIEQLTRIMETKIDKSELSSVRQELQLKSERSDVDLYVRAV